MPHRTCATCSGFVGTLQSQLATLLDARKASSFPATTAKTAEATKKFSAADANTARAPTVSALRPPKSATQPTTLRAATTKGTGKKHRAAATTARARRLPSTSCCRRPCTWSAFASVLGEGQLDGHARAAPMVSRRRRGAGRRGVGGRALLQSRGAAATRTPRGVREARRRVVDAAESARRRARRGASSRPPRPGTPRRRRASRSLACFADELPKKRALGRVRRRRGCRLLSWPPRCTAEERRERAAGTRREASRQLARRRRASEGESPEGAASRERRRRQGGGTRPGSRRSSPLPAAPRQMNGMAVKIPNPLMRYVATTPEAGAAPAPLSSPRSSGAPR